MVSRVFFAFLILLVFGVNAMAQSSDRTPMIGGVYEVGIGSTDEKPLIAYFERFGYRVGKISSLSAEEAEKLYGVKSALKSIRLFHQDSDHGLVRIMVWEKPVNEGLGLSPMKVLGNRWGAMLTADIYNIQNHAEEAIAQGMPVYYVSPQRAECFCNIEFFDTSCRTVSDVIFD